MPRSRKYIKHIAPSIYSFIQAISIAPPQVHYYSEALLTQHGYCVGVSCWSATGNCEWRDWPRSLRGARAGFEPVTLRKAPNLPMSQQVPQSISH